MAVQVKKPALSKVDKLLVKAAVEKQLLVERVLRLIAACSELVSLRPSKRSVNRIVDILIEYTRFESPILKRNGPPAVADLEQYLAELKKTNRRLGNQEGTLKRIRIYTEQARLGQTLP